MRRTNFGEVTATMWLVESLEFRARQLDLTSVGLGRHPTTTVVADGTEIVNALDFLELPEAGDGPIQLTVCDVCGTPGCGSASRVTIRRLGDAITMIPAFEAMARGSWEELENSPPGFVSLRGAPVFRGGVLDALAARLPSLADLARWQPLSAREVALLVQWEAPMHVLGRFPDPPLLRRDVAVAVDSGSLKKAHRVLEELLARYGADHRPVSLVSERAVVFYLDAPGFPEWSPLVHYEGRYCLAIAPGLGAAP